MPRKSAPPTEDAPRIVERDPRGRKKAENYPAKRPAIEKAKKLPFAEWAAAFLQIRNTKGRLEPFVLNNIQQAIDDEWEYQLAERGYVAIIVLKARKMGVSTYVQGKMFRAVLENEGWHASIMAHEDKSCQIIFERTQKYAELLPENMKRAKIRNNAKEIAYDAPHDSWLKVNVAKARGGFGRGGDYHHNHFSETSKWPEVRGQIAAEGQAAAIINSMPEGVHGTAVVDESTANGKDNRFYEDWVDSQPHEGSRYGKNGVRAMFFPWFVYRPYRKAGCAPSQFWAGDKEEWAEQEPLLRRLGCDDEQLAWRRWRIAEKCKADLDTFKQEYPATAEEAFLASGRPVFPGAMIAERKEVLDQREKVSPTRRFSFRSDGTPEDDKRGELRFWRSTREEDLDFSDSERFVIVADPAGAGANAPDAMKGDPACAYVFDRSNDEQIAEWNGWVDPDQFAQELAWLGALYRKPLMIVEAGPWGGHVISVLERLEYRNLYFRERLGDALQTTPTNWGQYGWITSAATKPLMIDALKEMWRERQIIVNSPECCSEHLTFVKNGVKREAQSGCHDDRVMCCAMYAAWAQEHPYTRRAMARVVKPQTMGDIIKDMIAAQSGGKGKWRLY